MVRHGRTEANRAGLLLGRADPELDDLGRRQAAAVAASLGPVERVISSPLLRTRETAEAFGRAVELDDRWLELDYGEWDGTPTRDVPPETWARWRADTSFAPPGGESLASLGRRVRAACDDLADDARRHDVVVVTHVSPIKAALAWALDVDDHVSWRTFVTPASVMRVAVGPGGASLHGFNDRSHLVDLDG
ncbi:MAG: histidine phosphatase family protein [Acidimicrobiales bacterium]